MPDRRQPQLPDNLWIHFPDIQGRVRVQYEYEQRTYTFDHATEQDITWGGEYAFVVIIHAPEDGLTPLVVKHNENTWAKHSDGISQYVLWAEGRDIPQTWRLEQISHRVRNLSTDHTLYFSTNIGDAAEAARHAYEQQEKNNYEWWNYPPATKEAYGPLYTRGKHTVAIGDWCCRFYTLPQPTNEVIK